MRFERTPPGWKDLRSEHLQKTEHPTITMVVHCSTTIPSIPLVESPYGKIMLSISHVKTFHGRQFMPQLYRWGAPGTGFIENGGGYDTIEGAQSVGSTMMKERAEREIVQWYATLQQQEELKARLAQQEKDWKMM